MLALAQRMHTRSLILTTPSTGFITTAKATPHVAHRKQACWVEATMATLNVFELTRPSNTAQCQAALR